MSGVVAQTPDGFGNLRVRGFVMKLMLVVAAAMSFATAASSQTTKVS